MTNQFTNKAYLLIGGNVGDRIKNLDSAVKAINRNCGKVVNKSKIYETAAWGNENQPSFLNQLLIIETGKAPFDLLNSILNIESQLGRERNIRYGPRLIDIDILYYNDIILKTPQLTIPHPRISERNFSLIPLMELSPYKVDPELNLSITELHKACKDQLSVNIFNETEK